MENNENIEKKIGRFVVEIISEDGNITTSVNINIDGFTTLEMMGLAIIVPDLIDDAIAEAHKKDRK